MTYVVTALVVVTAIGVSGTAAAQGRGGGAGKGRQPAPAPLARSGAQSSAAPPTLQPLLAVPQLGLWLDDATVAAPGSGFAVVGATYWRGSAAEQIDAPIIGVTYGITNRAQLSATVPFYRVRSEGFSAGGLDTVYIASKFAIVDPNAAARRIGVAVGAVGEILSAGLAEESRAHWVVPVSMEVRARPLRLYGSTGYFSRGAFFAAGALEFTAPTGTSLTASFGYSASAGSLSLPTASTAPASTLRDVTVFISHPVSSNASVYIGGSRTLSDNGFDSGSSVSGGLSFRVAGS